MYRVAALGLAPLLAWQGWGVRRDTPRLPEAAGLRTGRQGQGSPLRLLILGDSAAAGVGAAVQTEALSGHLVARLAPHYTVAWRLCARTGIRTAEAWAELQEQKDLRTDVAVISLGVNDVTALTSRRAFATAYGGLVRWLSECAGAERILVSGLPPVHRFPALPQPLRWVLGQRALALTAALEALAAADPRCLFLRIDDLTDPSLMASDGYHPGPAGYALWADRIAARLNAASAGAPRAGSV